MAVVSVINVAVNEKIVPHAVLQPSSMLGGSASSNPLPGVWNAHLASAEDR
jgi:hypothetical protein